MKIAYVCADRGIPIGGTKGASVHVRGMVQALVRRGHELRIVAARVADAPGPQLPAVGYGYDPLLKELRGEIGSGGDAWLASETCSLLLNGALRSSLDELDARWGVQAVYERFSLWSWAGLQFARERRLRYVLEVNAPLVAEQGAWRGLSLQPVAAALERQLFRHADAISVPSEALRDYVRAAAGRRKGVHVLPNGVDLALFSDPCCAAPAEITERLRGRFVVAFLGSLKPWHGIQQLWRAFRSLRRKLPEAHLLVIGDGPMREYLEQAAAKRDRDAITLTGAVGHERVPGLLALAHVGVAPYPPLDPFYFCPLKVIEYMAAGLPVVASAIGDIPRLVADGRTGLLVPPGDTDSLGRALLRLARSSRLRGALGARASRRARARFGWDRSAGRVEAMLGPRQCPPQEPESCAAQGARAAVLQLASAGR